MNEEVEGLRGENEILRQQLEELTQLSDLEVVRDSEALRRSADRILSNLKLGTQAPGYKVARKVLDQFIRELSHE